jgi:anti-anti-sigma factor
VRIVEMSQKRIGNAAIVAISGRIDAVTSRDLEAVLSNLIDNNNKKIVASLAGVEYISSAGLRVLLAALKRLRQEQGDLRLASLQPSVREVFDITGFAKLFTILSSEKEAVDSWR